MRTSLAISPSMRRDTGTPVHLATISATSSASTSSLSIRIPPCRWSRAALGLVDLALEIGDAAVADLGGLLEVGLALEVAAQALQLLLEGPDAADGLPLVRPVGEHAVALLGQVRELRVERLAVDARLEVEPFGEPIEESFVRFVYPARSRASSTRW